MSSPVASGQLGATTIGKEKRLLFFHRSAKYVSLSCATCTRVKTQPILFQQQFFPEMHLYLASRDSRVCGACKQASSVLWAQRTVCDDSSSKAKQTLFSTAVKMKCRTLERRNKCLFSISPSLLSCANGGWRERCFPPPFLHVELDFLWSCRKGGKSSARRLRAENVKWWGKHESSHRG